MSTPAAVPSHPAPADGGSARTGSHDRVAPADGNPGLRLWLGRTKALPNFETRLHHVGGQAVVGQRVAMLGRTRPVAALGVGFFHG